MPDMDNPLAVLTFIAGPAIITNACSMLLLNTTNRLSRVVDRLRVIYGEIEKMDRPAWKVALHHEEIELHRRRSKLLVRSMAALYSSIGAFAVSALLSLIGATVQGLAMAEGLRGVYTVSLGIATVGLVSIVVGCFCLFAEVRLAIRAIALEGTYVLRMDADRK